MARPKSTYSGLVNTSPGGSGMSGSKTVAEAVNRARTSINPHAGFSDFSPTQYLPDEDMYGATDVVEQPMPSYPSYGPPGFGDPSMGMEYGAIPNRGRMMREIDILMGTRPSGGLGGGAQHPSAVSASGPANQYSPSGYGGQRGVGAGGQLPNTGMSYGNPSMYGIGPESGNGPGAGMGGTYGQRPELPYEARAREASAKNIPWVDGPAGVDVGIGSSDPNLIGSIPWVDGPAGVDAGIGADFPAYNYVPWDPAGNESDIGMGGELFPQNTDFRGPSVPEGTRRQYAPSEDATRNDMGPLAGNLEMTPGDIDAVRDYKALESKNRKRRSKEAAAELAARYDLTDDQQKAQEEMYEEANKILRKQQIMTVLAAISGDPAHMQLAGQVAAISMARLENKYAPRMSKIQSQRMKDMMNAFNFNSKGEYDPPETQEEAMRALAAMGASKEESEALLGTLGDGKEPKWQNWRRGDEVRSTNTGMPPDDSGGWTLTGDTKAPASTADSGTGVKGVQRDEILKIRAAVKGVENVYGKNSTEAKEAREVLGLTERMYGVVDDAAKDVTQSATYLNNVWKSILNNVTQAGTNKIQWDALDGIIGATDDGSDWTAQKFEEWFKDNYINSVNNPVDPNDIVGVDEPDVGAGTSLTRAQAKAQVRLENPEASDSDIEQWLDDNGY